MESKFAVAYARYSSAAQSEISIEAQIAEIEKYAAKGGYSVIKYYKEPRHTGKDENRRVWQEMLYDLKQRNIKGVKYVIVHSVNRWARDLADAAWYKKKLEKMGYLLLSVREDISDPFTFGIYAALAEKQLNDLADEIRIKNRYVAKHAFFLGGTPPFGYDTIEKLDNEGKTRKVYTPNEKEAPIVIEIYEMAAKAYTYQQIVDYLNKRGIKTKYGNEWKKSTVYELLRNEHYLGRFVYGKGTKHNYHANNPDAVRVENAFPAIVPKDLWEAAAHRRQRIRESKYNYLLKGLAYCWCGSTMVGGAAHGEPGYRCSLAREHKGEGHINISARKLEARVTEELYAKWLSVPTKTVVRRVAERTALNNLKKQRRVSLLNEVVTLDKKITNAVNSILEGSVLSEELGKEVLKLKERRIELEAELGKAQEEATPTDFEAAWEAVKQLPVKDILQTLIKRIDISKNRYISIDWKYTL